jgi:hypothetical protein
LGTYSIPSLFAVSKFSVFCQQIASTANNEGRLYWLKCLPDVEFVIFDHLTMGNEEEDGDKDPETAEDHGPSLGTEAKATNFHFCHFESKKTIIFFV